MKQHSRSLVKIIKEQLSPEKGQKILGAEVGVWDGENAQSLLTVYSNLYLAMVDRYRPLDTGESTDDPRMAAKTEAEFIRAMLSAIERTRFAEMRRAVMVCDSTVAAGMLPDKSLDIVFIDGHHSYDAVMRDITTWRPKVRSKGVLCGHDYDGRGDRIGRFGVKQAVDSVFSKVNVEPGLVWWVKL